MEGNERMGFLESGPVFGFAPSLTRRTWYQRSCSAGRIQLQTATDWTVRCLRCKISGFLEEVSIPTIDT